MGHTSMFKGRVGGLMEDLDIAKEENMASVNRPEEE